MWWGRRRGEEGAQSRKSGEEEGGGERAGAGRWEGRWRKAALVGSRLESCGQTSAGTGPPGWRAVGRQVPGQGLLLPLLLSVLLAPGSLGTRTRRQADSRAGSPAEGRF